MLNPVQVGVGISTFASRARANTVATVKIVVVKPVVSTSFNELYTGYELFAGVELTTDNASFNELCVGVELYTRAELTKE